MDPVAALDAAGDAGPRPAGGAHRRRTQALPGRARADRADLRRGPPAPHHRPCAADRTGRCAGPRHRLVPMAPGSPTPRQDLPLRPLRSSALMISDLQLQYYQALDDHLWQHLTKWARRRHPRKSRRWIAQRYFGAFHPTRADRWIFGDRTSGAYLHRYAWTPIVRHAPVPGRYSPDDPALASYWADRRRKSRPPQLAPSWERLIRAQHGRCPACGLPLLHTDQPPDSPSQWEQWYRTVRKVLTPQGPPSGSRPTTHRLVHTGCATSPTSRRSRTISTTADPAPP